MFYTIEPIIAMKRIILIAIFVKVMFVLLYFLTKSKDEHEKDSHYSKSEINYDTLTNKLVNVGKLEECKSNYPFAKWRHNSTEHEMEQYTQENCEAVEMIFDELIADLKILPNDAIAEDKVLLIKYAVLATNAINTRIDDLIETGEREDLCELMDQICIAAGLEPEEFGDGEGIASEWREW